MGRSYWFECSRCGYRAKASGRLDRDFRDIMTACQHRVVHLKMYRPAGRLLLGLESEEPMF